MVELGCPGGWWSVLVCPEFCIIGAGIGNELAMSSLLDNPPSWQHQNLVSVDNRRQAMSDEDGCPVLSYLANGFQNGLEGNVRKSRRTSWTRNREKGREYKHVKGAVCIQHLLPILYTADGASSGFVATTKSTYLLSDGIQGRGRLIIH